MNDHQPFDVFSGHLGHLTPAQHTALQAFREILEKDQLYHPATNTSGASHDDVTLLRFLRARGFDPKAANTQFTAAEAWRRKYDVEKLYATFDPAELKDARRFYPRWTGRRDKNGLPLYVYKISSLGTIQKDLNAIPAERRYQRLIALYEHMTRFILPMCSSLPHKEATTPISSTTSIIDLKDVSFGTVWNLRNHLQEASRLATANYPETLGVIAIVNSPSFFPTIWSWLKVWFDERTQQKIHILGKEPGQKLRELVEAKHLPREYGGELNWSFEDEPSLDDATAQVIEKMPSDPLIFVDGVMLRASELVGNKN